MLYAYCGFLHSVNNTLLRFLILNDRRLFDKRFLYQEKLF
jgi:hypothetical protein